MNRAKLLLATSFIAASAFPETSLAQEVKEEAASGDQQKKPDYSEEDSDEVLVVGSLLRRNNFNSAAPITIVNVDNELDQGKSSSTAILQSNGITGGSAQLNNSYNGRIVDGGPGANTLGLRGLGAARSLVLLNGRRIAPAGTGGGVTSTDLNLLPPLDIVERYEVLRDGASSTYGSDAVAGVVNIVTKKKFSGVQISGGVNAPEHSGGGNLFASVSAGHVGERFAIQASASYFRQNPMTWGDRRWSACQVDGLVGANETLDPRTGQPKCYSVTTQRTSGSDGVTVNTLGTAYFAGIGAPGAAAIGAFNRWRPNASITQGLIGFEGVGGTGTGLNVRDTFDPRMLATQDITPTDNYTGFLSGSYDLRALGDAELYFSVLAGKRESSQSGYRQLYIDYPVNSPLIPSPLAEQLAGSEFLPAGGSLVAGGATAARAFLYGGDLVSRQSVQQYRIDGGIKGRLGLGDWRYDLYLSNSWTKGAYSANMVLTSRLAQSLQAVPNGTGGFSCADVSNGCVAAPSLTAATLAGDLPRDWFSYIQKEITGTTKTSFRTIQFNTNGTLFNLPYGPLRTAIGAEYYYMKLNDTPAAEQQNGDVYNYSTAAITRGSDKSFAVFGEVDIPILRNLPFAQELTLNASGRYTHYSSYGDGWTYKVSGLYSPVKWLSFRATYGTSFRAPSLKEQYQGSTTSYQSNTLDVCNEYGQSTNAAVKAHCAAEGLAPTFVNNNSVLVLSQGGKATGLKAETATNFTAGLVLQPSLPFSLGSLKFSADYYNIIITNGVSQAGADNIIPLCYNDPNWNNDKSNGYCGFIKRNSVTGDLTVQNNYFNYAHSSVRGLDFQIQYAKDFGKVSLGLDGIVTHYLSQKSQLQPGKTPVETAGTVTNPEWTGTLNARLKYRNFQFLYGLQYVSSTSSYTYLGANPSYYHFDTPDHFTHSASVSVNLEKFRFTAGVSNLFDTEPPFISTGYYSRLGNAPLYSGYDILGRTLFVNVSRKF